MKPKCICRHFEKDEQLCPIHGLSSDSALSAGLEAAALAKRFHETYEKLAPHYNYETRKKSAVPWDEVPGTNKALMIATCAEILKQGI